jgi:hypothetical protein
MEKSHQLIFEVVAPIRALEAFLAEAVTQSKMAAR